MAYYLNVVAIPLEGGGPTISLGEMVVTLFFFFIVALAGRERLVWGGRCSRGLPPLLGRRACRAVE